MFRAFCLVIFLYLIQSIVFSLEGYAAISYTPGSVASFTGRSEEVFFDVADEIYNSGTSIPRPVLVTATRTLSGAFYLSGAGWADFSTGSYQVVLDCSLQSLSNLSSPCVLDGVAYAEVIGEVDFRGRSVIYDPGTSRFSGTAATLMGEYDFSGVVLPLFPVRFSEGESMRANHEQILTLSGMGLHSGGGDWDISFQPILGTIVQYEPGDPVDLSHASIYRVEIVDPDDGMTVIDDFLVRSDIPNGMLDPVTPLTLRKIFCETYPFSSLCPDGSTLTPTTLDKVGLTALADGGETYDFTLNLRDRYGNLVDEGSVEIQYHDAVRDVQIPGPFPYASWGSGQALRTGGALVNYFDGMPTTGVLPTNIGMIQYSLASIAPTSSSDTLMLSGILYTDVLGTSIDIALPEWKDPLIFDSWYTTSLSAGPIYIGSGVDFITTYQSGSSNPAPMNPTAIYDITIGDNTLASFSDFASTGSIVCTKYTLASGVGECDWMIGVYDPVIIATESRSFSGKYSYIGVEPPPEEVFYKSYITYTVGGTRIIYPGAYGSLGNPASSITKMRILGQHNLETVGGVETKNSSDMWNMLHKNIALLSRNRSDYSDVGYMVFSGDISVDATSFTSTLPEKRTIITIGGDITLTSDIPEGDTPIALIALSDSLGAGGHIHIESDVTDIHASLFAEKSIHSSGNNQLYIRGTLQSYNTTNNIDCPYHDPSCSDPASYNIENLRIDYIASPGTSSVSLAGRYSSIPLVIEYDGRLLSNPPPGLMR